MTGLPSKSYGRDLLEKYGWTEGKGLGKTENGMVEALKPKLKCDNAGIGHDHAEQFTLNWWEMAFNEAAKRVSVNASKTDSNLRMEDSYSISTKRPWVAKMIKENSLKYGKFIKTETLVRGGETVPVQGKVTLSEADESSKKSLSTNLSDDELLKICGGRTAHKAARHGHKLVGKLARVIEQEKKHVENSAEKGEAHLEPASQVISTSNGRENVRKKKRKKVEETCEGGKASSEGRRRKKREKEDEVEEDFVGGEPELAENCDAGVSGTLESSVVVGGEVSTGRQGRRKKKRKKNEVEEDCVGGEPQFAANCDAAGAVESVVGGEARCDAQGRGKKKRGKDHTQLLDTNSVTLMGSKRKKYRCE